VVTFVNYLIVVLHHVCVTKEVVNLVRLYFYRSVSFRLLARLRDKTCVQSVQEVYVMDWMHG